MGHEEDYDECTVITLAPGEELIEASTFDEAFGKYSNAKGRARRQARKAARQTKRMTRIDNRVQRKTARKVGRQVVKANKQVAKQQRKQAKQVAKQTRKTAKTALRQDRKGMRVQARQNRKAMKQVPEEVLPPEDEQLLDAPEDQGGMAELETGAAQEAAQQDYAEQSNPEIDAAQEAQTEEEAEMANEGGGQEAEEEGSGEEEWTPDEYDNDADVDETEYGFNGDMDEASNFDANIRKPDPKVQDTVNRIERNKFRIFNLKKMLNADGGDQLAMQREVNQREDRIEQLKSNLYDNFCNARGGKRAEKRAAKAEVKAAKKAARREIKQQAAAQRSAARPSRPAFRKRAAPKPPPPPPAPPVTPVDNTLNAQMDENCIDIPGDPGVSEFTGRDSKPSGMIFRDDASDYDAGNSRVIELHSNASGDGNSSALGRVAIFIGLTALAVWGAKEVFKVKV